MYNRFEQDRLDILTGRDVLKGNIESCSLDACPHCKSPGEICLMLSKPYVACTNSACGASTGSAEDMTEAAAKWNRRDG